MENSNVTGKVIGAIMIGTLIGATIGLLFAPYKGSRTRNRIARKSKDLAFKMKKEADSLLSKAEELERLAEKKLQNITSKAKESVESLKNKS
ncbi:MAG TPA: YtxH domain-containing protein [Prolixibacteraceae bacterium]|nr:YtxH domain-containing protein [Prolixibacteraceae bacterium]